MKVLLLFCAIFSGFLIKAQNNISDNLVLIPSGKFKPGNNINSDEKNNKHFKIKSFCINKYETTNSEYCNFLNSAQLSPDSANKYINLNGKWRNIECGIYFDKNIYKIKPGYENLPVVFVNWFGAKAFCSFYNLRLPSELEWEYAAKNNYTTDTSTQITEYAWFNQNSQQKLHASGQKKPNTFKIYDMQGNVAEWCNDWYFEKAYQTGKKNTRQTGRFKVHRGGSWTNSYKTISTSNRRASNPYTQNATIGFRTAKSILD